MFNFFWTKNFLPKNPSKLLCLSHCFPKKKNSQQKILNCCVCHFLLQNKNLMKKISGRKMSGPHDGSVPVASLQSVDPPSIAKPFGPLHRSPLQRNDARGVNRVETPKKKKKTYKFKWQSMLDSNSASFWVQKITPKIANVET